MKRTNFSISARLVSCCLAFLLASVLYGCNNSENTQSERQDPAGSDTTALSHLERGRDLLFNAETKDDYPKAIEYLEKAVAADPNNASAQVALVYAYTKRGKYTEAAPYLTSADALRDQLTKKDKLWLDALATRVANDHDLQSERWLKVIAEYPEDRWAWYELAVSYTVVDRYELAADACAKALAIEPDPFKWSASYIYYVHSKALYRLGDYEATIKAAEAGRSDPLPTNWNLARYNLSAARVSSGQVEDMDAFEEEYIQAMRDDGRHSDFLIDIDTGFFFFEVGEYERALKFMKIVHDPNPLAITYSIMGYSLTELGRLDEAFALLDSGLTEFPNDAEILTSKAWALYRVGQYEEAKENVVTAISVAPRKKNHFDRTLAIVDAALEDPNLQQVEFKPWVYE